MGKRREPGEGPREYESETPLTPAEILDHVSSRDQKRETFAAAAKSDRKKAKGHADAAAEIEAEIRDAMKCHKQEKPLWLLADGSVTSEAPDGFLPGMVGKKGGRE